MLCSMSTELEKFATGFEKIARLEAGRAVQRHEFEERLLRAGLPRSEVRLRPATGNEWLAVPSLPAAHIERGYVMFVPAWAEANQTPGWADAAQVSLLEAFAQRVGVPLVIKPHPLDRECGRSILRRIRSRPAARSARA